MSTSVYTKQYYVYENRWDLIMQPNDEENRTSYFKNFHK